MRTKPLAIATLTVLFASHAVLADSGIVPLTTREVYLSAKNSVVLIMAYDKAGVPLGLGSGFFISERKIVTNHHVIKGAARIVAKNTASRLQAEVKGINSFSEYLDLAVLELEAAGTPLPLSRGQPATVGDKVIAIGNPHGLEGTVSEGIISATRNVDDFVVYQITAPISPGSSGGPIFNESGEVIGVATATIAEGQNLNFAMPLSLIPRLKKGGTWEPSQDIATITGALTDDLNQRLARAQADAAGQSIEPEPPSTPLPPEPSTVTAEQEPVPLGQPTRLTPAFPFAQWIDEAQKLNPHKGVLTITRKYLEMYGPPPQEEVIDKEAFMSHMKERDPLGYELEYLSIYNRTFGEAQRAIDATALLDPENAFLRQFKEAFKPQPQLIQGLQALARATGEKPFGSGGAFTRWKEKALEDAGQGNASGQVKMGYLYALGLGVPQDYAQAHMWFNLAAAQGDKKASTQRDRLAKRMSPLQIAEAQLIQGLQALARATGEKPFGNGGAFTRWKEKALEDAGQGNASGQVKMGYLYALGLGVPQDYAQAHMWSNLATAQGDKTASTLRDQIAKRMTPEQIADAQRLAREWRAK